MNLVLDVVLKSSALLLVAFAAVAVGRRSAAAQRHLVWTLALAGLVALPLLTVAVPWRLPVVPTPTAAPRIVPTAPRSTTPDAPVRPEPSTQRLVVDAHQGSVAAPAPTATSTPSSSWSAEDVLRALWIIGLALLVGRLLVGMILLQRILATSEPVGDPAWDAALARAAQRLGVTTPVRMRASDRIHMPMTSGARRPVIIVPAGWRDWSPELRDVVLLHELAHIRRGDLAAQVLGQLACALYWFQPLAWGAARRLRIEAERACDDLVLGAGAPASSYARQLLTMVQSVASARTPVLAVPMAQPSEFEGRVLAILAPNIARHGVTRRAVIAGALTLTIVALPLAALGPSQARAPRERERRPEPASEPAWQAPSAHLSVAHRAEALITARSSDLTSTAVIRGGPEGDSKPALAREPQERVGGDAATAALLAVLDDADVDVRVAAAQALGDRQDTAAVNALIAAMRRDASKDVRKTAAWALGQIEDARAVPGLVAALREERDVEVRRAVVHALGEIENDDAVSGLGAALRTETDADTRHDIVWALGQIENADAVPMLIPVLRDADTEMRHQAAWALGQIESPASVDALVGALGQERDSGVREVLVWALGQIEDRRAAPALEGALRDTSLDVRRKAVWALGQLDELHAAPAGLLAALRDDDIEVRRSAAQALSEIQDPASVTGLVTALRDTDLEVRRSSVRALGEIRSTAAVEALVAALHDQDPEIRRLAAQALGNR